MGKAISHSDCARQTPELLGPGKGTKCRPNRICASEGYLSAKPERLRLGRCLQLRVGLRGFWRSNVEPEWCAPRAGAGPVELRHCKHTPALLVCSIPPSHSATEQVSLKKKKKKSVHHCLPLTGQKSDTEETSKQKKLTEGTALEVTPYCPQHQRKGQIYLYYFYDHSFCCCCC